MKQILTVDKKNYEIVITDAEFSNLMEDINTYTSGQKRLIVISKKVYKIYRKILNLSKDELFILKDGEKEKNYENYIKIIERATELGLTRSDVIIAIGGGVVGDIAGFAASTYMRGIDYIQVPTTLLAMVDSSVGGKTAIDFNGFKNILGSFYQPKKVFIDINFLNTLDKRQYYSGLGEVLKYSFIEENCGYSKALFLFEYLTLCVDRLKEKEPVTLMRVIEYCLNLKIAVVNEDEKEAGLRKVLNFGHTYAHALEALSGLKKYTHGEAVVQGMYFMLDWAYDEGMISYSYYRLSVELLEKYGFVKQKTKYSPFEIVEAMKRDKKALHDKITLLMPCDKKRVKEIKVSPDEVLERL